MTTFFDLHGIDYVLGEITIDIEQDLPQFKDAIKKSGIKIVRQSKLSNVELGVLAAEKLISRLKINRTEIEALIVVTQSSMRRLPGAASHIQNELRLKNEIFSFDINQGCSGFVQGMLVAVSLLSSFENVLLVTTDTYRSKLNPSDRSTNAIFSDGATASLISRGRRFKVLSHTHLTDGSKSELLHESPSAASSATELHMSGAEVFLWTRSVVGDLLKKFNEDLSKDLNLNFTVFTHQASGLVIEALQTKLGENTSVIKNYERIGNTVSSSIPILISDNWKLFSESPSICIGFGVGLSLSAIAIAPNVSD
jgi:3-oxoacyl-[acyl-carrier-protein] synthase-3